MTAAQPARDYTARNQLVLSHIPMVKAIALQVHKTLPVHVDLDDMIHSGILGLFEAADRYDAAKNDSFGNYARYRVLGAILDSLRQLDWASKDMRIHYKRVQDATSVLATLLKRMPTEDEVREHMGITPQRWQQLSIALYSMHLTSESAYGHPDKEPGDRDFPTEPDSYPDYQYAQSEMHNILQDAIKALPKQERKIVNLRYLKELRVERIANRIGISPSRVSQLSASALTNLRASLASVGIHSAGGFQL